MKFSRPILMFVIIAILAIAIALFIPISSAERKGEDADPPEHGDWVIDSIGNYIGNETDWVEVIHGEPPTEIPHDDAVKLDGNITIKNGGELTLYNTTINMTDHNNFHIIIEENGTLIMEWGDDDNSTCKILNNNQSYIGFMEIKGNLSMNLSSISQVNNIFVNSSVPTLSLNVASFGLQQTFYIKDQNLTFEWADIFSETDMALSLYNTTIHWKGGTVNGLSNTTESTVLYLKDSEVVADRLWVTSGSDYNICLYLDNSAFTATNSWIGRANGAIALYATKNSYVNLSKTRVFSKGENLMECFGSQVIITDSNLGNYKYYQQKPFISGFFFKECDVLF
ncbi:MAG: hypothetical protein KAU14_08515, partial [Thermoplasmata archaeon]|nr:hypothetical protein [Thermoplasmata archaeon]